MKAADSGDARATALRQLESFQREDYHCPWWANNGNVNSIAGALFQSPKAPPYRRERYDTDDGGFFDVDFLSSTEAFSRGMVVLLHGLESCSTAPLTVRQAKSFAAAGFDVAAINFRGCSKDAAGEQIECATATMYHLGYTDDVKWLLTRLHQEVPTRRMYLSGVSLGGNVATKALGELGESARDLNVCGGAVGCVPINLVESAGIIDRPGFNKRVYSGNFLKTMCKKASKLHAKFPAARKAFSLETVAKIDTLGELDNSIIAPLFGFEDKLDYYRQSDSRQYLSKIQVPHYVINARDDPFFCPDSLPDESDVKYGTVRIDYSEHGGHCGFVENESVNFSPARILTKLLPDAGIPEPSGNAPNGYLPEQLARMLEHLDAESGGQPTRAARLNVRFMRRMLGASVVGARMPRETAVAAGGGL